MTATLTSSFVHLQPISMLAILMASDQFDALQVGQEKVSDYGSRHILGKDSPDVFP